MATRYPVSDELFAIFCDDAHGSSTLLDRGSLATNWTVVDAGTDWNLGNFDVFKKGIYSAGNTGNRDYLLGPSSTAEPSPGFTLLWRGVFSGLSVDGFTHIICKEYQANAWAAFSQTIGIEVNPSNSLISFNISTLAGQYGTSTTTTIPLGVDLTIILTYDGTTLKGYVNGSTPSVVATPGSAWGGYGLHGNWFVGSPRGTVNGECFKGITSEARFFPSVKDSTWIANYLSYGGATVPTQGLNCVGDSTKYAIAPSILSSIFDIPDGTVRTFRVVATPLLGGSTSQILFSNIDNPNNGFQVYYRPTQPGFYWSTNAGSFEFGSNVNVGAPTDMVVVVDSTNASNRTQTYYQNGTSGGSSTSLAVWRNATLPVTVGIRDASNGTTLPNTGIVQEITVWNRALTSYEVSGLWANGRIDPSTKAPYGLILYWPLNGDTKDWSDGFGNGANPLTVNGGIGYATGTPIYRALSGTPPLTLSSCVLSGSQVTITFSQTLLNSTVTTNPASYTITPPVGTPNVTISSVQVSGTTIVLNLTGDMVIGGSYGISIPANTVFGSNGSSNNIISTTFTGSSTTLHVSSVKALTSTEIQVAFNKAVRQVSASNSDDALHSANYSVPGLTITGVISINPTTVILLNTPPQTPTTSYNLTVSNVKDIVGNVVS